MRYAIGDIHGGNLTFQTLLRKINFRRSDRLILLGDYVDRGPDSRGVLDTIMGLMRSGYDVKPLRGNHDDIMLRNFTREHDEFSQFWWDEWGRLTLKSFGVDHIKEVPSQYLKFLDTLPYCLNDGNFLLVHAGLDMLADDPLTETSHFQMLWGESALLQGRQSKGKTLVTGHHIHSMPLVEASLATNHIFLDNGAFTNQQPDLGNLIALNLDTMVLTKQAWLDGEAVY